MAFAVSNTLNVSANQLKPDTLDYFRKVDSVLSSHPSQVSYDRSHDLEILLKNIFNEIGGCEEALLLNRHTSYTLEKIFAHTKNFEKLKNFFYTISDRFLVLCRGRNSSHPLEALINKLPEILENEKLSENGKSAEKFSKTLKTLLKRFSEEFLELSSDSYATFVSRALIRISTTFNQWLFETNLSSKKKEKENPKNSVLKSISKSISELPQQSFEAMCLDSRQAPTLAVFLQECRKSDAEKPFRKFALKLFKSSPETLLSFFKDKISSFLMQSFCELAGAKEIKEVIKHIKSEGNLSELIRHDSANFAIQKLCSNRETPSEDFKYLSSKVIDSMDFLIETNKFAIVNVVAEGCAIRNLMQSEFVVRLSECLKIPIEDEKREKQEFLEHLIYFYGNKNQIKKGNETKLKPKDEKSHLKISYFGCVLLKNLLKFNFELIKPLLFSFKRMNDQDVLIKLATNPSGSRLITTLLDLNIPKDRVKNKLIKRQFISRFKRRYVKLATNKFGCSVLEKCILKGNAKQRKRICEELRNSLYVLLGNKNGQMINNKYSISMFRDGMSESKLKEWNLLVEQIKENER